MKPNIKPFDFSKIPQVSSSEMELLNSWERALSALSFSSPLQSSLIIFLNTELHQTVSFEVVKTKIFSSDQSSVASKDIYVSVRLEPFSEKFLCQVDGLLVRRILDTLLGKTGKAAKIAPDLTEIEEGVFSYFCLKLFSVIFEKSGREAALHYRLENMGALAKVSQGFFEQAGRGVEMDLRISLGKSAGYLKFFFPWDLVQELVDAADESVLDDDKLRQLERLNFLSTSFWSELGRTSLKVKEINALEEGDVVLLEDTQARVESGVLKGLVSVHVGKGEQSWPAQIVEKSGSIHVQLTDHVLENS